jgi:hypothetical protein
LEHQNPKPEGKGVGRCVIHASAQPGALEGKCIGYVSGREVLIRRFK